jgi:integrase/recombinase XerD
LILGGVLDGRRGEIKGTKLFKQKQEISKTFKELFEKFLLSIKVKGRSEYTIRSYKYQYIKRYEAK